MKRIFIIIMVYGLVCGGLSFEAMAQSNLNGVNTPSEISGLPWEIKENRKEKVYPILISWLDLPYTPLNDGLKLKEYLAGIELNEGSALLTEEERAKLNEVLLNLCLGFSTGVEEDYFAFRTPKGPEWRIQQSHLVNIYAMKGMEGGDFSYNTIFAEVLKNAVGERGSYKNFWKGICLDPKVLNERLGEEISIYIPHYGITVKKTERFELFKTEYTEPFREQSRQEEDKLSAEGKIGEASPFFLEYWTYQQISFQESPSQRSVYKDQGTLLLADIHLLVERGQDQPPGPVFIRFYWSPEFKVWIPCGFTVGKLNGVSGYSKTMGAAYELF